ncbi:unnamed protein product [Brassica rapa]|uniref:Uncharacterized protein n=2 Tax=Brassica TaxID=3705 RepID=A0A8D9GLU0_BRACM|nr:unnamed protein product [Brassica napus]CAG7882834.1 unnamed protein product [Brassica rapa]
MRENADERLNRNLLESRIHAQVALIRKQWPYPDNEKLLVAVERATSEYTSSLKFIEEPQAEEKRSCTLPQANRVWKPGALAVYPGWKSYMEWNRG